MEYSAVNGHPTPTIDWTNGRQFGTVSLLVFPAIESGWKLSHDLNNEDLVLEKVLVHGAKENDHDYSYPLRQSHEGASLNLWCGWLVHRLTFLLGRYAQLRGLVFEAAVASCVRLRFIPGVRISQYGRQ